MDLLPSETSDLEDMMQRIMMPNNGSVPALGQGTWNMGDDPTRRAAEIGALQRGVELGMTVIDTAEMYGNGASERLVGEALVTQTARSDLFIVSKALPDNATPAALQRACQASLQRLGTDYLDLYLLHWRGSVPLKETVRGMQMLQSHAPPIRCSTTSIGAGQSSPCCPPWRWLVSPVWPTVLLSRDVSLKPAR
jgi:diketogulonate reductase-like aldo/keto reductase